MSSPYPVLGDRPIDQWKVTELKEELKRRKLMTKGLKEDLIKRLDEAIRNEQENLNKDNGFDSVLQSEALPVHERAEVPPSEKAQNAVNVQDTVNEEKDSGLHTQITHEQESSNLLGAERAEDAINHGESRIEKTSLKMLNVDINDIHGPIEEEQVREGEGVDGADAIGMGENQMSHVISEKTNELVSENPEPVIAPKNEGLDIGTQSKSSDGKAQLEDDNSKSLHGGVKDDLSDTNNQVSEVNPVLGFQVKSESISTETVSIIEKNELKDNIIANDVKLELDVKPQMIQPSSGSDVPDGGKLLPVDVEEPHANIVSVEEAGGSKAECVDVAPKNDTGDLSSSQNLNLDQSSCDDLMDEDVTETKQMGRNTDSEETRTDSGKIEASAFKDEGPVTVLGEDVSADKKVFNTEEKNLPAVPSVKRKLNDQVAVGNTDVVKRQRRWNSEGLKIPEAQTDDVSTTPKDVFQPAFKRSFSRSDSSVSEEVPKERVVPPPANPPTNSLRVDRFLRPFTLKAVQELLGKTGTVTSFWMDHIKTHCYVSFSSVDEAIETRNAVYNLQWPPNGGRLLVAEFVDPQEVKARLEAPPQSPATPVSSGANNLPITQKAQPQPSPRPQVPKQQLPQPPPPPPPTLSNPPVVREQIPPPVRERLPPVRERLTLPPPPPPPLAEKAEAPIVTLDDLFRKTKATPRIYYLPLSDEQVAAKLQAQGKTVKQ